MTDYLTEQEQIDLLKNWIKQYSLVIISGILLAIIFASGWRYWHLRQEKMLNHASHLYTEMLNLRAQNKTLDSLTQGKKLLTHYQKTVYAQFAAFLMAKEEIANQQYPIASKHLHWVINHSATPSFRQIARIRLARVQLAQGDAPSSLKTLARVEDKTFQPLIDEVTGDAYLTQNQTQKARQYYAHALKKLPNADMLRPILQMKYDNLRDQA